LPVLVKDCLGVQTSKLRDKMVSVSARTKVELVCKAETHRSRIAQLIIVQMYYYLGFSSFRFDMTPSATDNSSNVLLRVLR
jgi:hypothetical protein